MGLRDLNLQIESNEVTLSWDWPIDQSVSFALVFKCTEKEPDVEKLLSTNHPHEIVARDLASSFTAIIDEGQCKFLICPAYFDESKIISVCTNAIVSEWIYKKTTVTTSVSYKPIPLSQYHKATLQISIGDREQAELLTRVLTYTICEPGYSSDRYPIDLGLIYGTGHLYIKKSQLIKFDLHKGYSHLFELR